MRPTTSQCLVTAFALACSAGAAQAATAPVSPALNPGLINKQGQRNLNRLEQGNGLPTPPPVVKSPAKPASAPAAKGPSFLLRGVRVDVTPFLSRSEIDAITSRYVGRTANFGTLQRIVDQLNQLLTSKREVTASAYLPPQTIRKGVVHVAILQGRLGALDVTGNRALSASFVRSYVHVQPHQIVDLPQVATDLARFNDTGLARIQAIVRPGSQFGLTDIRLAVTEPPRNLLQVFADNQGVSAVGRDEVGVLYQRYAPAGIDDRLTLYALKSQGDEMGSLAYDLPIDTTGGRAGFSLTSGNIRDVSGIYQSLGVSGWSNSVAANVAQPLYVGQNWIWLGTGSLAYEVSKSFELDTMVVSDAAKVETVGLKLGYSAPRLSAGGTLNTSFVQSHSQVSEQNTDFALFGGTFYLRDQLPRRFVGVVSGAWQVSTQQFIPGGQLFQVGGPTTVRGYSSNALAGPSGYYANFELHHPLRIPAYGRFAGAHLDGFVFLDQGGVFNHYPHYQDLRSVGGGFSWGVSKGVVANLSIGFPIQSTLYGQPGSEVYFSLVARLI